MIGGRHLVSCATVAAVLAGCTHGDDRATTTTSRKVAIDAAIADAPAVVRGAYVSGDRLHGFGGAKKLAAVAAGTLTGTMTPAAVRHGDIVVYDGFRAGAPEVRVREGRRDRLLARGAFSVAVARDGRVAYFRGRTVLVRDPRRFAGDLVVRAGSRVVPWTPAPGRYLAAAWSGDRLLAYRLQRGWPDLLVLDRPGRMRVLARRALLVALDASGDRALVSLPTARELQVVAVPTGEVLAWAPFRRFGVQWVAESGTWERDRVAASTSAGLAVFRVGDRVHLERVLRFSPDEFPTGLREPVLAGDVVTAWGELAPRPRQAYPNAARVECRISSGRCVRGRPVPGLQPPRPVRNPSRP